MAGVSVGGMVYEEDEQQLRNVEKFSRSFPRGVRFVPTDEELILHYLTRKIENLPIPPLILEVDLYKYATPNDLIERCGLIKEPESRWYFFTLITKIAKGKKTKRTTPGGHWKATIGDVPVCSQGCTIGYKKTLCFYERAEPPKKTNWIMHEFRIDDESWVVCRVYKRNVESSGSTSQSATVENIPNHANEEVMPAVVPASVTNEQRDLFAMQFDMNEQRDSFAMPSGIATVENIPNHANEEVMSAVVPASVTNNANEPMNHSEMIAYDNNTNLWSPMAPAVNLWSPMAPAVATDNMYEEHDLSEMTFPEMGACGIGYEPLQNIDGLMSWRAAERCC